MYLGCLAFQTLNNLAGWILEPDYGGVRSLKGAYLLWLKVQAKGQQGEHVG